MKRLHLHLFFIFFFGLTAPVKSQAPENYYSGANGLEGEALKTSLFNIIKDHTVVTYHSIPGHFETTDLKPSGKIWDIYSDLPGNPPYEFDFTLSMCASALEEGECYNREHSWPRSWYGPGGNEIYPMHSDLFHVYPVDAWVNELRSNFPFGVVNSPTTTTLNGGKLGTNSTPGYSGTVFEPIDAYKGDLARTYFYMATRYEDLIADWNINSPQADAVLNGTSFPVFETWFLDLLISWHEADPVSEKEINRNNAVYAIQGNRNPFIDEPGYVQMIWGDGFAPEPENHVTSFSAQTITLSWTDAAGPTPPETYLVRMSDAGFDAIPNPVDGNPVENDFWNKNVAYGIEGCTFGELTSGTVYYFKIFSFRGSGPGIDYKTDGDIPQISIQTK